MHFSWLKKGLQTLESFSQLCCGKENEPVSLAWSCVGSCLAFSDRQKQCRAQDARTIGLAF